MTLKIHKVTEESKKRDKELLKVSSKAMECSQCTRIVERCSGNCQSVICPACVQKMIDPPYEIPKNIGEKKPRGWHLKKEYISVDGKIYHFGVELDEKAKKSIQSDTKKVSEKTKKPSNEKRKRGRPKKTPATP